MDTVLDIVDEINSKSSIDEGLIQILTRVSNIAIKINLYKENLYERLYE